MLSNASLVWNRACLRNGGDKPAAGDIALAALLLAHGLVMNGGVVHMAECLGRAKVKAACKGFRFYRFEQAARTLEDCLDFMSEGTAEQEVRLNDLYYKALPNNDADLCTRFEKHFATHPKLYAPLSKKDRKQT